MLGCCDQFGTCHMSNILIRVPLGWSGTGSLAVGGEVEGMEVVESGKETPNHSLPITTRKCNKKDNKWSPLQWCMEGGQEKISIWGQSGTGRDSPERLWDLCPWRFSCPGWIKLWVTCFHLIGGPALSKRLDVRAIQVPSNLSYPKLHRPVRISLGWK